MSEEAPQTSLPQRSWIAKFTPDELEAYLSNPDPSSQLRRSNTVWSDDFDNLIGPFQPSSDDHKSWSRRRVCHGEYARDSSSLMTQGPHSARLLLTDDCFLDGLVDGFGIMVVGVVLLGAIAAMIWLLGLGLRSRWSTRRHRYDSLSLPLLGDQPEVSDTDSEATVYVEKV
jgi:hypothetical protein